MAEESDQQITFNVKSSADQKFVITIATSATILDLKQKLSAEDYAAIPPERQRLIYSGRVLKDPDTVASCKIKDGNTVHMVKGADSNSRQNPANQGGSQAVPQGAGGAPAGNVPSNIAAGTGASNPLAQLTGARYAGFHNLPGAEMFGADGGMGAPPNPDQMLRLLDDPNFASQMNEAMNNPAVIDMLRNNPMIRDNPIARQAIENPEFRRMMMNPDMIRMQMQMQRAMGGGGGGIGGGNSAFPMPGQTDTTPSTNAGDSAPGGNTDSTQQPNADAGTGTGAGAGAGAGAGGAPANPFAALFPGAGGAPGGQAGNTGSDSTQQQQNPFGSLFGNQQGGNQNNPLAQMTNNLMQNPEMMQQFMNMMNGGGMGGGQGQGNPSDPNAAPGQGQGGNPFGGMFNPYMFGGGMGGGMGGGAGQQGSPPPQDDRPPEQRYEDQLRQLNDMGFYEFERNVQALRRSGGSVQGAVEYLLSQP